MKFQDLVTFNNKAQKNGARDFRIQDVINDNNTYVVVPVDKPIREETRIMDGCWLIHNIRQGDMRITNLGLMRNWRGFA